MSSAASDALEVAFPTTMPRLPYYLESSSAPLSNIFLPEIDESPSNSPVHSTTYVEANAFTAINEMILTPVRRGEVFEPLDSDSDRTVSTSPPPQSQQLQLVPQEENHHEDSHSSDGSFNDNMTSTTQPRQKHAAKTQLAPSSRPSASVSASASASSQNTRAKRTGNGQRHQVFQTMEPARTNLSSSPTSERVQPQRPRLQDIENRNSQSATPEDVKEEDIEEPRIKEATPPSSRSLRRRTVQQTHPYIFELMQHNLAKSTGVPAMPDELEDAVQEVIDSTPKEKIRKKARLSTGAKKKRKSTKGNSKTPNPKRRRSESLLSVTSSVASPDFDKTTLQIWLNGFSDGAAPVTLNKVSDVDELVGVIVQSWGWKFEGQNFSHAIASFPWLSDQSNILIRTGMGESFQKLMQEVTMAPVWAEESEDRARYCEVKVTVFVKP